MSVTPTAEIMLHMEEMATSFSNLLFHQLAYDNRDLGVLRQSLKCDVNNGMFAQSLQTW